MGSTCFGAGSFHVTSINLTCRDKPDVPSSLEMTNFARILESDEIKEREIGHFWKNMQC